MEKIERKIENMMSGIFQGIAVLDTPTQPTKTSGVNNYVFKEDSRLDEQNPEPIEVLIFDEDSGNFLGSFSFPLRRVIDATINGNIIMSVKVEDFSFIASFNFFDNSRATVKIWRNESFETIKARVEKSLKMPEKETGHYERDFRSDNIGDLNMQSFEAKHAHHRSRFDEDTDDAV